jgi:hypothetical protein
MSRYSFQESIRDRATLPLHFEAPEVKLKIDRAAIDDAFKQITGELSEQDRDDLAKRAAKMAVLVKNPERIQAVVNHIVKHYQAKVEPNGFKAQVVVFDRECCVLYKRVMDELIGPEASAIVMTGAQHDPPEWKQHMRDKDAEEKLLDRFRDPADPLPIGEDQGTARARVPHQPAIPQRNPGTGEGSRRSGEAGRSGRGTRQSQGSVNRTFQGSPEQQYLHHRRAHCG